MTAGMDLEDIRTFLLISLSILVVVAAYKRFKQYVQLHHAPVPQHVELAALEVMYHPSLLRVELAMPASGEVFPAMLSGHHAPLHAWPAMQLSKGTHVLELPLDGELEGHYFFEIATGTQRTERRFTVRPA